MGVYVWWFVIGLALLIAELTTGTFYLLVLAIATGAAGLASLIGAPFAVQLLVAAVIGVGGSLALRRSRAARQRGREAGDVLQNLDVGQVLRINQWSPNRTARAAYRGAQWDVELAQGEEAAAGEFVIREIHANRLVVAARKAG